MSGRSENFIFRVSKNERQLINDLAKYMDRTPGDAARFIVLSAAKNIHEIINQENFQESNQRREVQDVRSTNS